MGSLTFLNSPLLWGLGLASIPIIIHLLFRRRYRRVEWAPMKYLKLTIQRNRRRIQLEQLLLLLLRVVMVLLLFFFLSRPVWHAAAGSSWWSSLWEDVVGGGSRASQFVLLDDSLSMGLQQQGESSYARAVKVIERLAEKVRSKDRFSLLLASRPQAPLLHEIEVTSAGQVTAVLAEDGPRPAGGAAPAESRPVPSAVHVSWSSTLEQLDALVAASTFPLREVTLITDFQRAGWDGELTAVASRWAAGRVRLTLIDVGSQTQANRALVSLEQTDRLAMVGAAVRFEALVRNDSTSPIPEQQATWLVDGNPNPIKIPPLPAGGEVRVPLSARFQEPGTHHVSLRLSDDELNGDNQRWCVVRVQQTLHVVLVDGEPSSEPLGGELDFLGVFLAQGLGDSSPFQVDLMTDADWSALAGVQPDLMVLGNVATLTPDQARLIERLVAAGMGLVIYPGEQLDAEIYNRLLFRDGSGPLPAALEAVADEEVGGLVLEPTAGLSPLSALGQLNPAMLEAIRIQKHLQVKVPEQVEGTRVLARWNNPQASPALVTKPFGRGEVLLWTVTADKQWSNWPTDPTYVLAMRESALAVARSGAAARPLVAGETLRRSVPADREVRRPTVSIPRGAEPLPLPVEATPAEPRSRQPARQELVLEDTRRAGLYSLQWTDSRSGAAADQFAVNPDGRESELGQIPYDQVRNLWGTFAVGIVPHADLADFSLATGGQEIWRSLATWLLALVVVESCLATWAGRQR